LEPESFTAGEQDAATGDRRSTAASNGDDI
jgi:hypothetical protein